MESTTITGRAAIFLDTLKQTNAIYWKQVNRSAKENTNAFMGLADHLLSWAEGVLGDNWPEVLVRGYIAFVNEVNKSQAEYELLEKYKYSTFSEVANITYGSPEFMALYHWGVFTTTFAWEHHLYLNDFFDKRFIPMLARYSDGNLIDLGTGSGVWLSLALSQAKGWSGYGIDISPTSVAWAKAMTKAAAIDERATIIEGDALAYKCATPAQAAISCFVLEHLEEPIRLLKTMAQLLEPGAPAFVCAAITAAEIDHIYEFRKESDLVALAENAGFRVCATFSAAPARIPSTRRFIPRSMGMVLERHRSEWW